MRYYRCGNCGREVEADHCIDNCLYCDSPDLSRDSLGYVCEEPLDEDLEEFEDTYYPPVE